MQKIIDYNILLEEASDLNAIINLVKKEIKQGWQPIGAPFTCGEEISLMAQAMVKYSSDE